MTIPTAPDMVSYALDYAARGWPVFPVKPNGKEPATHHGCKDATTNPNLIRDWWHMKPDANVAIATGSPGPDVLDVDLKPDASGYPAFRRLAREGLLVGGIALVRTPSGGTHVYYEGTEQGNGSLRRHLIDFRGKGGYVVADRKAHV